MHYEGLARNQPLADGLRNLVLSHIREGNVRAFDVAEVLAVPVAAVREMIAVPHWDIALTAHIIQQLEIRLPWDKA